MADVRVERPSVEQVKRDMAEAGQAGRLAQPPGASKPRTKASEGVAATSSAYDVMAPRWRLIDALLGGTDSMREAAKEFLPRHEEESDRAYGERLDRAVLLNMTEQTLDQLVGKAFSEPPVPGDDIPAPVVPLLDDVDLQGNALSVFARRWFRDGVAKAFSHVLVDFPRAAPRPDGQTRTLDDDRRERARPYWVHVRPENVLAAYAEMRDGQEVLTHVRVRETTVERVGFEEREVTRVRVLEPGRYELWEPQKVGRKTQWTRVEEGETGLSVVPLVTFYADREGPMLGKPPLTDLAHLNVAHWQSSSDQTHVLTVARFPILAVSGATGEDAGRIKIGPNAWLATPDPNGKWYYVEHTGAAIEAGRKDLEALESQMAGYGAQFLKSRPGNETATARALDSSESTSDLQAMVKSFSDAIAQALALTAAWMQLGDAGGHVDMSADLSAIEDGSAVGELLLKARVAREISHRTFIEEMKTQGLLSEELDADEELERIAEETEALAAMVPDVGDGDGGGAADGDGAADGEA